MAETVPVGGHPAFGGARHGGANNAGMDNGGMDNSGMDNGGPGRPSRGEPGDGSAANRLPPAPARGTLAMIAAAHDLGTCSGLSFALGAGPGLYAPMQLQPEAAPLLAWPAQCGPDLRRRMSDHIAYALLAYTALQIFVTMSVLRAGNAPLLPFVALIVLVAAIIPACRRYEMRWSGLSGADMADPALPARFRRDLALLWLFAAGLPFVITGLFVVIGDLAG